MNDLLNNINKLHTTAQGITRIKNHLGLYNEDVVAYCKRKILHKDCHIYQHGKNWYCEIDDIQITVNSFNYTIITAYKMK